MQNLKSTYRLLFFLCFIFKMMQTSYAQFCIPEGDFQLNHTQLQSNTPYYFSNPLHNFNNNNCPIPVKKAQLFVKLDLGDDYDLGALPFNVNVNIQLNFVNNFGLNNLPSPSFTLALNQTAPEALYVFDMEEVYVGGLFNTLPLIVVSNQIKFTITSYNFSNTTAVTNSVRLSAHFKYEERIRLNNLFVDLETVGTSGVVEDNPVSFQWQPSCPCVSTYVFQLLHLYNTKDNYTNEHQIRAKVDWKEALTLDVESKNPNLSLTLAEGKGYYLWRVRPVGSEHSGGSNNPQNLGPWSNQGLWQNIENAGGILDLNLVNGVISSTFSNFPLQTTFFYQQFDDDKNWTYSRNFSEADRWEDGKIKFSEKITYANGLLQPKQHQTHLFSQNNVLANQTLLDFTGRPTLTTLYAPLDHNYLAFEENFILTNNGQQYTSAHFDSDASLGDNFSTNYNNPNSVTGGKLHNYYSNSNLDATIPSAEGYPFARNLYYGDGMNRLKEASGIGSAMRINNSLQASHTTRIYDAGVADKELTRVFGDEAPLSSSVLKQITYDPNQTVAVTYKDKFGKTLATCLSTNDNTAHHDPLSSRSSFSVVDTISGYISCGDNCLRSTKTFHLAQASNTFQVHYELTPQSVQELCTNSCTTCDFQYKILIKRIDNPYDDNFPKLILSDTLAPGFCTDISVIDTTIVGISMPAGLFMIEKIIEINNIDPLTQVIADANPYAPYGTTYLESHLATLEASMISSIETDTLWQTINNFLLAHQTEALYAYLEANHGLNPTADSFTFHAGCCDFTIPISPCENCPISGQDFEAYYNTIYPSGTFADDANTSQLEYLPGYQVGQFNSLVQNMLNDATLPTPYNADSLCYCWVSVVQAWAGSSSTSVNLNDDFDFDVPTITSPGLLEQFLQCAGRKLRGFTTTSWSNNYNSPGYLSHAYAYFNYSPGAHLGCESTFCQNGTDFSSTLVCNGNNSINWSASNLSSTDWLQFYQCTQYYSTDSPNTGQVAAEIVQELSDACNEACDGRYDAFVTALTDYYQNDLNYAVQSACQSGNCITISDIYCQAEKLVALCKQNCAPLSAIMDGNTITGYGTPQEIEAYIQAMYYAFEVVRSGNRGRCPSGFSNSTANLPNTSITGIAFAELVLNYLNVELGTFINNTVDEAPFNVTQALNNFQNGLANNCPQVGGIALAVPAVEGSFFSIQGCRLYFNYATDATKPNELTQILICTNICGTLLSCGNACLRWIAPLPQTPDHVFEYISCQEQTATYTSSLLQAQLQNCLHDSLSHYMLAYRRECIHPDSIRDLLSISYGLGYYHYTLYYYDRAGNLVQTVPPQGVRTNNNYTRLTHPPHEMRTQYQYNALKQLVWQHTPDGGTSRFWYNHKGQLRFAQNAQQVLDNTCTYTQYDHLGQVIEVGKMPFPGENALEENADSPDYPQSNELSERIYTIYSTPYPGNLVNGKIQQFLQNRISYTVTEEQVATIYSYDPHGNVEYMVQDIMPELPTLAVNRQFLVEYEYDLLSNKVTEMRYMPGRADQFFHRYSYDEDNRITEIRTSRDGYLWDRDTRYNYFAHGPLRRIVLGEDGSQGLDYVYTIQGWLKSINHPILPMNSNNGDPGRDGYVNSKVARDVFASGLTYYRNDFIKQGSSFQSPLFTLGLQPERDLYNGNVSLWVSNTQISTVNSSFKYPNLSARMFSYDELNRLTKSDFRYNQGSWRNTEEYDSDYSYDANGNLLRLNRNGYNLPNWGVKMDNLKYYYNTNVNLPKNNRLERILDISTLNINGSPYPDDLERWRVYTYDAIGNQKTDYPSFPPTSSQQEDIQLEWNLLGKVKRMTKTASEISAIDYRYDAMGNRTLKKVSTTNGSIDYTWYVRDATGHILATYTLNGNLETAWQAVQKEVPLYGSRRLGTVYTGLTAFGKNAQLQDIVYSASSSHVYTRALGRKAYEIPDHLGNVRMTVSDIKLSSLVQNIPKNFRAEILSGAEYYPFGSLMPGRAFEAAKNRFGFQGQETDHEEKGTGNDVHFTFREYDSRVGRFGAVDPIAASFPWNSAYAFSENRVIDGIELEGLQVKIGDVNTETQVIPAPHTPKESEESIPSILMQTMISPLIPIWKLTLSLDLKLQGSSVYYHEGGIHLHRKDGGENNGNTKSDPSADVQMVESDLLVKTLSVAGSGGQFKFRGGMMNIVKSLGKLSKVTEVIYNLPPNTFDFANSTQITTKIIEAVEFNQEFYPGTSTLYKETLSDFTTVYRLKFSAPLYGVHYERESSKAEFNEALKDHNNNRSGTSKYYIKKF